MYDFSFRVSGISAASILLAAIVSANAQAATFIVNRTGDTSGACTTATCNLRQAIDAANAGSGSDTIHFDIPACGTKTILITGATLHIAHPIIIDGSTQPQCGTPNASDRTSLIEIRGPGVTVKPNGTILHGLVLDAGSSGSTIRSLAINGFSGSGIGVASSNNFIFDNKLGTDPTGNLARPNDIGITIGTNAISNDITNNVISGNQHVGIDVLGDSSEIYENFIGTKIDGATALGNGTDGISTFGANDTLIGVAAPIGNTIAFNNGAGVRIGTGSFNAIFANKIFSNQGFGVVLTGPSANQNQAAPVITSITRTTQVVSTSPPRLQFFTVIKGSLASGGSGFKVDLYGNTATCDSSNAVEGESFLITAPVASDGTFFAAISISAGASVTALARSPEDNTSPFSACKAVP